MHKARRSCIAAACLLSIVIGGSGCGSATATVSGKVTYSGGPVKSGSVVFFCADKQIVRGLIVDGDYTIPNVPRGRVIATVQATAKVPAGLRMQQQLPPMVNGPAAVPSVSRDFPAVELPARYALPEESGLVIDVQGSHVTYEIDLKP